MADPDRDVPMPPHAYVPGFSPRHPENLFDDIKASVTPEISPDQLHLTKAFIAGRSYLQAGYYWECHEVLEAVWMQTRDPSPERDLVLAMIQLANAKLKLKMNRPKAAWRLCDMVETHLSRCPRNKPVLGIDTSDLLADVKKTRTSVKDAF